MGKVATDATLAAYKAAFDTFLTKVDEQNNLMGLIAQAVNEDASGHITSFSVIKSYLKAGLIRKILNIGDQIRVNKETSLSVTITGSITAATVVEDTFLAAVGSAKTAAYEFAFDGAAWQLEDEHGELHAVELSTYGITVTGTPASGDKVVVHEQASEIIFDVAGIINPKIPILKY